jgi:hypothetical protein
MTDEDTKDLADGADTVKPAKPKRRASKKTETKKAGKKRKGDQ